MEKGGMVGIIYGIILLIIGGVGLYNKQYLCSVYVAAFLFILGILALIVIALAILYVKPPKRPQRQRYAPWYYWRYNY